MALKKTKTMSALFSQLAQKHRSDHRLYTFVCATFSIFLVLSNLAVKIIRIPAFPNLTFTSGILTYPITFLLTDFVSEVWGPKKARFMIYLAFSMNLLMLLYIQATIYLPAHPAWVTPQNAFGYSSTTDYQNAYESVFSVNKVLFLASMVAFMVSQLLDVKVFCYLKNRSKGKHLWLRNNASTLLSQLIDTLIMTSILGFVGLNLSVDCCFSIIKSEYLYKAIFALLDTPFIYLFVYLFKKWTRKNDTSLQPAT